MQFTTAILTAFLASTALAAPAESDTAAIIKAKVDAAYAAEGLAARDDGLEKRACNYNGCDDCLSRAGLCRVCQGPGDHLSACLGCLQICFGPSKCGC
ncbi:mold-specific M46 protein [Colletotrichum sojae]|uniref:Mold-specific M46 protein n=1 Tax=Colletotrichum sojae TaxID=2175907 RepID=A0A8H6IN31_9PEZI|nr:mold-specific M46 protein [Colletotrichum sojae]